MDTGLLSLGNQEKNITNQFIAKAHVRNTKTSKGEVMIKYLRCNGTEIFCCHHDISSKEVEHVVCDVCTNSLQHVFGNVSLGLICKTNIC